MEWGNMYAVSVCLPSHHAWSMTLLVSGIPSSCEQHDAASLFTGALSWS